MNDIDKLHEQILNETFTPNEKSELMAILDPVIWASGTLRNPENPNEYIDIRDYQCKALRAQPYLLADSNTKGKVYKRRIKVYRMGRRIGKTVMMAVEALHKACTNSNFRIIYIAPFEAQCNTFFNIIEKLMTNTVIKTDRFVRKPFIAQFPNGSTIMCYTANVRSSRKGSTIRGAEGDHIIIDEMDHGIDEVVNEVVMPIYLGNNSATITAASTPTGRRGLFYLWCTKKVELDITEFHYSSRISPRWTEESERMARATMTREQYEHEIDADFGEALEGVFRHKDLDLALVDYDYRKLKYNPENAYVMGVDWNEKYGVCLVIVEKSKKTGKFRVFKHKIIEKQEFVQTQAIQEIIKIHTTECNCNFIYVDHGYGATQVELLKTYGMANQSSNISNMLRDIDYGGKISIRDPQSGQMVDKPAKAFLVNTAQLVVEANDLFISEEEDTDYGIVGQMRNFRVAKLSATGVPVFEGDNNDHSLNALMLALVGFRLEMSSVNEYKTTSRISNISNLGISVEDRSSEFVEDSVSRFRQIISSFSPNYRSPESFKVFPNSKLVDERGGQIKKSTFNNQIRNVRNMKPRRSNI